MPKQNPANLSNQSWSSWIASGIKSSLDNFNFGHTLIKTLLFSSGMKNLFSASFSSTVTASITTAGVTTVLSNIPGAAAPTPPNVALENLVMYLPFDGDFIDYASFQSNGTGANGVGFDTGVSGQAISCDNSKGGYVYGPADNLPTAERTVSLWFKLDAAESVGVFGYGGGGSPACGSSWIQTLDRNQGDSNNFLGLFSYCGVNAFGSLSYNSYDAYDSPAAGNNFLHKWHHWVTMTYPGSVETCHYLDGMLAMCASPLYISNTFVQGKNYGVCTIVAPNGSAGYEFNQFGYFEGYVDELQIFNRALGNNEILSLYNWGLGKLAKNQSDIDGALLAAVYEGDVDGAVVALNHGANVNIMDLNNRNNTLLHIAAGGYDDPKMTTTLLNYGANANALNWRSLKPIDMAYYYGRANNSKIFEQAFTLLFSGLQQNNIDTVKAALSQGANVNGEITTDGAHTPILWASVKFDNPRMLWTLLRNGADPSAVSPVNGWTIWYFKHANNVAYYAAADDALLQTFPNTAGTQHTNELDSILMAIWQGANVNIHGESGHTPLHFAAYTWDNPDLLQILIDNGADPNAVNGDNQTPLQLAEIYNMPNNVNYLSQTTHPRSRLTYVLGTQTLAKVAQQVATLLKNQFANPTHLAETQAFAFNFPTTGKQPSSTLLNSLTQWSNLISNFASPAAQKILTGCIAGSIDQLQQQNQTLSILPLTLSIINAAAVNLVPANNVAKSDIQLFIEHAQSNLAQLQSGADTLNQFTQDGMSLQPHLMQLPLQLNQTLDELNSWYQAIDTGVQIPSIPSLNSAIGIVNQITGLADQGFDIVNLTAGIFNNLGDVRNAASNAFDTLTNLQTQLNNVLSQGNPVQAAVDLLNQQISDAQSIFTQAQADLSDTLDSFNNGLDMLGSISEITDNVDLADYIAPLADAASGVTEGLSSAIDVVGAVASDVGADVVGDIVGGAILGPIGIVGGAIVGFFSAIGSLFGPPPGPTPEQKMLGQMSQQISGLASDVDYKFSALNNLTIKGFTQVFNSLADIDNSINSLSKMTQTGFINTDNLIVQAYNGLNSQFNVTDKLISQLDSNTMAQFRSLSGQVQSVSQQISQLQTAVKQLQQEVNNIYNLMFQAFESYYSKDYVGLKNEALDLNNLYPVTADRQSYLGHDASLLVTWATTYSKDPLMAGITLTQPADIIKQIKNFGLISNIDLARRYFNTYVSQQTQFTTQLANPSVWSDAATTYVKMLDITQGVIIPTDYSTQIDPNMVSVGQDINAFVAFVRNQLSVFNSLCSQYSSELDTLVTQVWITNVSSAASLVTAPNPNGIITNTLANIDQIYKTLLIFSNIGFANDLATNYTFASLLNLQLFSSEDLTEYLATANQNTAFNKQVAMSLIESGFETIKRLNSSFNALSQLPSPGLPFVNQTIQVLKNYNAKFNFAYYAGTSYTAPPTPTTTMSSSATKTVSTSSSTTQPISPPSSTIATSSSTQILTSDASTQTTIKSSTTLQTSLSTSSNLSPTTSSTHIVQSSIIQTESPTKNPTQAEKGSNSNNTGAIVGGFFGVLAGLSCAGVVAGAGYATWKKRNRSQQSSAQEQKEVIDAENPQPQDEIPMQIQQQKMQEPSSNQECEEVVLARPRQIYTGPSLETPPPPYGAQVAQSAASGIFASPSRTGRYSLLDKNSMDSVNRRLNQKFPEGLSFKMSREEKIITLKSTNSDSLTILGKALKKYFGDEIKDWDINEDYNLIITVEVTQKAENLENLLGKINRTIAASAKSENIASTTDQNVYHGFTA